MQTTFSFNLCSLSYVILCAAIHLINEFYYFFCVKVGLVVLTSSEALKSFTCNAPITRTIGSINAQFHLLTDRLSDVKLTSDFSSEASPQ
jgi:hypothetical protein